MQFFEKHIQMKAFFVFFCECKLIVNTVMWKRKQWSQAQQQISNRMLKKKRLVVLQWSGQYQTSTWLRCCYRTSGELCINQYLQMSTSWSNAGAEGGSMSYWMTRFLVFTAESCEMFFLTWQCMFRESVITRGTADKWWSKKRTNSTKFSAFCNKFKYLEFYFNFTASTQKMSIENTSLHMDKVWY